MKEEIKLKFINVYKLSLSVEDIKDDEDLFGPNSPYGLDSMDVLAFVNELKKAYGLVYSALDTESFKTINKISTFIENQKAEVK